MSSPSSSAAKYACNVCEKTFAKRKYLNAHTKRLHTINDSTASTSAATLTCTICGKTFAHVSKLQRHQLYHYKVKELKCTLCDRCFTDKKELSRHLSGKHKLSEKKFQCPKCSLTFLSEWELKRHSRRRHQITLACTQCKHFTFETVAHYISHMKFHRNIHAHLCDICGMSFRKPTDKQRHVDGRHEKVGRYKCSQCGQVTAQPVQMDRHITSVHITSIPPYTCLECAPNDSSYSTPDLHAFQDHMAGRHGNATIFTCNHCHAYFIDDAVQYNAHVAEIHFVTLKQPEPLRLANNSSSTAMTADAQSENATKFVRFVVKVTQDVTELNLHAYVPTNLKEHIDELNVEATLTAGQTIVVNVPLNDTGDSIALDETVQIQYP